eukprot:CAMPEP_0115211836 /NCGR_PEP_ID=MMETSP0270-20121206/22968_1 /TAXON_ID=71861 /ORGANISM="Scrippsiella trochoidea, Strain CCMP3099" /LENGTH=420 /DNA_ID=CAMNT_0002625535 /DNA_START=101 /DNA_END=1360 /DNA_ORIENTATION=+
MTASLSARPMPTDGFSTLRETQAELVTASGSVQQPIMCARTHCVQSLGDLGSAAKMPPWAQYQFKGAWNESESAAPLPPSTAAAVPLENAAMPCQSKGFSDITPMILRLMHGPLIRRGPAAMAPISVPRAAVDATGIPETSWVERDVDSSGSYDNVGLIQQCATRAPGAHRDVMLFGDDGDDGGHTQSAAPLPPHGVFGARAGGEPSVSKGHLAGLPAKLMQTSQPLRARKPSGGAELTPMILALLNGPLVRDAPRSMASPSVPAVQQLARAPCRPGDTYAPPDFLRSSAVPGAPLMVPPPTSSPPQHPCGLADSQNSTWLRNEDGGVANHCAPPGSLPLPTDSIGMVDSNLPSYGTRLHDQGACRPCHFWFRSRCTRDRQCTYCHVVHPGQVLKRIRLSKRVRLQMKEQQQQQQQQQQQ